MARISRSGNRYSAIIEAIFHAKHRPGEPEVPFDRAEIVAQAAKLGIATPKNLGDLIYSFRYRTRLPRSVLTTAPGGKTWIIRSAGRSSYRFVLVTDLPLAPNRNLAVTKVPHATPGIIARYAFSDEQAVLALVRYNRLVDLFLGIACYSLQNHLRTTGRGLGQVETDEIAVGIDKNGAHYVVPVQAKSGSDQLSRVQIEQDIALCAEKLPSLICRPVGMQLLADDLIALFSFEQDGDDIKVSAEQHYRLVAADAVTDDDLERYRQRLRDTGMANLTALFQLRTLNTTLRVLFFSQFSGSSKGMVMIVHRSGVRSDRVRRVTGRASACVSSTSGNVHGVESRWRHHRGGGRELALVVP